MPVTLGAAARQIGVSKATISKAISSGKLSATRREDGSWSIDEAELARYINANGHRFNRSETGDGDQVETVEFQRAMFEERIAELKTALADMRAQRDSWQAVAERLTISPPAPPATPPETPRASVPTVTVVARRPWWRRLAG